MADKEPSMLSDLVKGALTTAISIVVTYYVTSAIKKGEYQKDDVDKEKQRMESLEKTSSLLNDYIARYDSLHVRYNALLDQRGNKSENTGDPISTIGNSTQLNSVSQFLVTGNWVTPDGTIGWHFDGSRVTATGIGSYSGFIEAAGTYTASGGTVSGTLQVSKAYYLPVNETLRFSFQVNTEGTILYGTNTDGAGNVNAMTLYKN